MRTAVIIPFRPRPGGGETTLLRWVMEGYAKQRLAAGHSLTLHIGIDGGADKAGAPAVVSMDPSGWGGPFPVHVTRLPRIGAAGVRNALAAAAEADLLIFGNGDARPDEDMVQQHATAMAALPAGGAGMMVLGSAPWERPERSTTSAGPTVFDVLLAETPMVFFYGGLTSGACYDFRHAWTLNLSVRRDDFMAAGGFYDELRPVYFEDLALGYRLLGPARKGVFYHPAARVLHRHPTTLEQYLDREELLGLMAPVLARVDPAACQMLVSPGLQSIAIAAPKDHNPARRQLLETVGVTTTTGDNNAIGAAGGPGRPRAWRGPGRPVQ